MGHGSEDTLRYSVRPRMIAKYLAQLLMVFGLLMSPPAALALASGDGALGLRLAAVALFFTVAGFVGGRLPAPGYLQQNEALTIIALAFAVAAAAATWPLMTAGLPALDAWFEAVSGITTTGLSTLAEVETHSSGFLFTRAWLQWCGGLGFVALSLALVSNQPLAARRLIELPTGEELLTTSHVYARRILVVYLALTLVALAGLYLLQVPALHAATHALAAVSTGGFSSLDQGLAGLPPAAAGFVMVMAFLGAVSLSLYHAIWRQGPGRLFHDSELGGLILISALSAGVVWLALPSTGNWQARIYHAVLNGVSAQTTTGFSTFDFSALPGAALAALLLSMLIGGSVGSSAGGIKLLRLLAMLSLLRTFLRHTALAPHAVDQPHLGGRPVTSDDFLRATTVLLLFLGLIFLSWLTFLLAGHPPLPSLFEVVSAVCTVGLSTGLTSAELEPWLKAVLTLDMLAGRVEIIALVVVLLPRTWLGRRM